MWLTSFREINRQPSNDLKFNRQNHSFLTVKRQRDQPYWKSSEELVSQNADFWNCIFCTTAVFFSFFRFKNHHCILYIRKVLKNGKRLVAHRYSLRGARFAKYRFSSVHILHFCCFIPCFGYRTEEYLIFSFQYMFIHFVSFRFVSQIQLSLMGSSIT